MARQAFLVDEPMNLLKLRSLAEKLFADVRELSFDGVGVTRESYPSAMLFVRNQHGSHNPREAMDLDDFMLGVDVVRSARRYRDPG